MATGLGGEMIILDFPLAIRRKRSFAERFPQSGFSSEAAKLATAFSVAILHLAPLSKSTKGAMRSQFIPSSVKRSDGGLKRGAVMAVRENAKIATAKTMGIFFITFFS
jgi:hypothetical protein